MDFLARRSFAALTLVAALAVPVAGCGSDKGEAASPLDNALGYVPADSPFVASFDTDPNSQSIRAGKRILEKFPFASQVEQQLGARLKSGSGSVNYNRDVKPLLGNEFVVAAPDVKSFVDNRNDSDNVIAAIETRDAKKLKAAVEKDKDNKKTGEQEGATVYKGSDGDYAAIKDKVLVVAGTKPLLDKALKARAGEDRFTEDDFDGDTKGLPKGAPVRIFADVQKLINADPDTVDARKVKWVKALRDFGLTASVANDKVDVAYRLSTDSNGLTEKDLPIAPGDQSPALIKRSGELGFGMRDPGQLVRFGEAAAQAIDPQQFGSYETAKQTVERQLKIDLDTDVIDQLNGDVAVSSPVSGGQPAVKAAVKDPAAFKKTLAKVTKLLPAILQSSTGKASKVKRSGDLYSLTTKTGPMTYGVVDDSLVVARTPAEARRVASAPTTKVPGAQGSVVTQSDAQQLVVQALRRVTESGQAQQLGLGSAALGGSLFSGPLGDLTGSTKADTSGLSGKTTLSFD